MIKLIKSNNRPSGNVKMSMSNSSSSMKLVPDLTGILQEFYNF